MDRTPQGFPPARHRERVFRGSALEWVIVRPVGPSDAPAAGHDLAGPLARVAPLVPLTLADCAACLLRAVSEPAWTRQIVNLGRSLSWGARRSHQPS